MCVCKAPQQVEQGVEANAGPYPLHKSGTLKSRLGVRDLSVTWGHGRVKCRPYPLHKSGTLKSDKPFQIWFRGQEDLYRWGAPR